MTTCFDIHKSFFFWNIFSLRVRYALKKNLDRHLSCTIHCLVLHCYCLKTKQDKDDKPCKQHEIAGAEQGAEDEVWPGDVTSGSWGDTWLRASWQGGNFLREDLGVHSLGE